MIPKKLTLFATDYLIIFDEDRMNEKGLYGMCEYSKKQISLTTKYNGCKLTEATIEETFYHEKIHAILEAMNETELNENEKFVDIFAKLLRQSDITSIY